MHDGDDPRIWLGHDYKIRPIKMVYFGTYAMRNNMWHAIIVV